ncbi:hypothetical protein EKK58_11210 [Candidatus Dependentiae bacterium]|nr:MAG: hypothetical protein EKK58_11210 [Candidatus Dependentiae bacterium]
MSSLVLTKVVFSVIINLNMATNETTLSYLQKVKLNIKQNKYRKKFDGLYSEIQDNLINTGVVKGKIDESRKTMVQVVTLRADGSSDFAVFPQVNRFEESLSETPRSAEAIAFSKIITAVSAVASRIPDGSTFSTNKIKARAYYELWKRSWALPMGNGQNTLSLTAQNIFTYGWGAWRVFPKQETVKRKTSAGLVDKVLFDDIFREPLDPNRTWLGLSYRPTSQDGRPEVYYEVDVTKERYEKMKKEYNVRASRKARITDDAETVTLEAIQEDSNKSSTHVTICFYENPLENRMIVATQDVVFYDGEIPNDEVYGSVVVGHCFLSADVNDPYGVGYWELMRGNQAIYNFINSLTTEQVEAEVAPLLFVSGMTGNGDMTYKRSAYRFNTLPAGAKVDKINTTGNSTLAINYADKQKVNIEDNTGINNIVSGASSDSTLGGTVILKEAALARLSLPRNSLAGMIEFDSCITFSWFDQEQGEMREFIFSTEEQAAEFMRLNPSYEVEENYEETETDDFDEYGVPIIEKQFKGIMASERVPLNFDFNMDKLRESDYQDQNIIENGSPSFTMSKNRLIYGIKDLESEDKIGYAHVTLKVDPTSMLIPSAEIEKQNAMQVFPVIQNSIQIIFGLARQDPEQAKAQLNSLKKFIEIQKMNLFDFIPKSQYDAIMAGKLTPTPQELFSQVMGEQMGGGATQSDGTSVEQPQNPMEMGSQQTPMMASMQASVGRAASGV